MSNQFELLKIKQDKSLRERYNVSELQLAGEILKFMPAYFATNEKGRRVANETMTSLLTGNANTPMIDSQLPQTVSDNRLSSHLTATAKLGNEMNGDYEGFNKILDSFNSKIPKLTNPVERNIFISNNLEAISKSDLTGANISTISKVKATVDSYLEDKSFGIGTMFALVQKHGTVVDVLPDGRVSFTGPKASEFNSSFGVGINHAIGAYAKVHNITTKEAATKFYPEYFDKYVSVVEDKSKP